jgi:hypothetical protein
MGLSDILREIFTNTRIEEGRIVDNPFAESGRPLLKETKYFLADTGELYKIVYRSLRRRNYREKGYKSEMKL